MMFQQNGIDINFICKSRIFCGKYPKGSPEGTEGQEQQL